MMYAYVRQNILYLLHRIGTLQREQLLKFFSPELSVARTQRTLNELVLQNELKFDPKKERYSFHSAPEITENVLSRRIDAFWVVANMGSINVVDVDLLEYPSQFSVIDVKNNLYDITVCMTTQDATMARLKRERYMLKDRVDDVNHIAVVYKKNLGELLGAYGFDSFAMIDPDTHEIKYQEYKNAEE